MADIPDGFEEVIPDGFEEVTKKPNGLTQMVTGGLDAAVNMAAQLPSYVGSGLAGLGKLATTGDISQAGDAVTKFQESNFGMGAPKPFTEKGQEYVDNFGNFIEKGKKGAGDLAVKAGLGELGRTNAEIAYEGILNFLPVPGFKGLKAVREGLRKEKAPIIEKEVPPAAKVEIPEGFEEVTPQTIPVTREGQGILNPQDAMYRDLAMASAEAQRKAKLNDPGMGQQELPLASSVEQIATEQNRASPQVDMFNDVQKDVTPTPRPVDPPIDTLNQHSLFDQAEQGSMPNQFEAKPGEWRVDENGMPIRADLSMELQNLENPLQRNLWGDELGPAQGAQLSLTDSIDSMDWAHRKGVVKHFRDLEASGALEGAIMEANSPFHPPQAQLGAIDVKVLAEFAEKLRKGIPLTDAELSILASQYKHNQDREAVRGALPSRNFNERPTQPLPPVADTPATPRTPENIATRQEKVAQAQIVAKNNPGLASKFAEFDAPATVEEAIHLSQDAKDIGGSISGNNIRDNLSGGIRVKAAFTNHPLIKWGNKVYSDARAEALNFSREFVTKDKTGLANTISKLDSKELATAFDALLEGDRRQKRVDTTQMPPKVAAMIESFYKADAELLARENKARTAVGLEPIKAREGHLPGIFVGNYKTLVLDSKKNVIGVIATDTRVQTAAKAKILELHPDATFLEAKRQDLGGNSVRSDLFSGMNDVMQLLADNDPKFAQMQAEIANALKQDNKKLYGFNKHEMEKKGILGNEGNKPWLDRETNAKDMSKALLQYMEEGAQHYALQKPLQDVAHAIQQTQDVNPNAAQFMRDYTNHVKGAGIADIGKAINIALDAPFKAVGVGSRIPFKLANEVKNRMSQVFMGFGNWVFTLTQVGQLMQSAMPFADMARGRLGMGYGEAVKIAGKASIDTVGAFVERFTGKKMPISDFSREAFKYAESRGMMTFSEIERAQDARKGKLSRGLDSVAEFNMQVGETGTRPMAFMTIAHLLNEKGIPKEKAFQIAENITQIAMIDYHPWERPRVYAKMGVLGQFAGGLTTYKHGFMAQQGLLMKQVPKGQISPILGSTATMMALTGLTGVPFYGEADSMFQAITDMMGEKRTIRETVLKDLPEWQKSGALSTATGLAVGSKFSSANMLPDKLGDAASPHLAAFAKILGNVADLAHNPDDQAIRNLLMSVTPNGPARGMTESAVARNPNNTVIDKEGLPGFQRTDDQWAVRKATGSISLDESLDKQAQFDARAKKFADDQARKSIGEDVRRSVINGTMTPDKLKELQAKYIARKGSPEQFVSAYEKAAKDKQTPQKIRDAGVPGNSLASQYRYKYFNKD